MDMIVRFLDSESNKVTERSLNSKFRVLATAADKWTHLKKGMALLNLSSFVQIFMDVPM